MRLSIAGWLVVIGLLIGTFSTAPPTSAQQDPAPFQVGDGIELRFETATHNCIVQAIRGSFVQCSRTDNAEYWYNINSTHTIIKRAKSQ